MAQYGTFSMPQFFKNYYRKTHLLDTFLLKESLYASYLEYIDAFPLLVKPVLSDCGASSEQTRTAFSQIVKPVAYARESITKKEYDERFPRIYWLEKYVTLRLKEVHAVIDEKRHKKTLREMAKYNKYLDNQDRVMHYINTYVNKHMQPVEEQATKRLAGALKMAGPEASTPAGTGTSY